MANHVMPQRSVVESPLAIADVKGEVESVKREDESVKREVESEPSENHPSAVSSECVPPFRKRLRRIV